MIVRVHVVDLVGELVGHRFSQEWCHKEVLESRESGRVIKPTLGVIPVFKYAGVVATGCMGNGSGSGVGWMPGVTAIQP